MYGYESFPVGACGSALKAKGGKQVFLTTGDAEVRSCIEACKTTNHAQILWSLSFAASSGQLQPKGVVLITKKQLSVPAGSQKQF